MGGISGKHFLVGLSRPVREDCRARRGEMGFYAGEGFGIEGMEVGFVGCYALFVG